MASLDGMDEVLHVDVAIVLRFSQTVSGPEPAVNASQGSAVSVPHGQWNDG